MQPQRVVQRSEVLRIGADNVQWQEGGLYGGGSEEERDFRVSQVRLVIWISVRL